MLDLVQFLCGNRKHTRPVKPSPPPDETLRTHPRTCAARIPRTHPASSIWVSEGSRPPRRCANRQPECAKSGDARRDERKNGVTYRFNGLHVLDLLRVQLPVRAHNARDGYGHRGWTGFVRCSLLCLGCGVGGRFRGILGLLGLHDVTRQPRLQSLSAGYDTFLRDCELRDGWERRISYLVARLNIPSAVNIRDRASYSIKPFPRVLLPGYRRSGTFRQRVQK